MTQNWAAGSKKKFGNHRVGAVAGGGAQELGLADPHALRFDKLRQHSLVVVGEVEAEHELLVSDLKRFREAASLLDFRSYAAAAMQASW